MDVDKTSIRQTTSIDWVRGGFGAGQGVPRVASGATLNGDAALVIAFV
jgi:hypothetical protein